jgi:putative FmdB family regulatory protein
MPIYEYQCVMCAHETTVHQKLSDDTIKDCPSCKEPFLKRLISGGSVFKLKGEGFYKPSVDN